jgi:hypothetical protein
MFVSARQLNKLPSLRLIMDVAGADHAAGRWTAARRISEILAANVDIEVLLAHCCGNKNMLPVEKHKGV